MDSTPTTYEELTKSHIQSASINGLIHRGDYAHRLHIPTLVSKLINLNTLLDEYTFWNPDQPSDKELALAVNEWMAYIYLEDERIDLSDIKKQNKKSSLIREQNNVYTYTKSQESPPQKKPNRIIFSETISQSAQQAGQ